MAYDDGDHDECGPFVRAEIVPIQFLDGRLPSLAPSKNPPPDRVIETINGGQVVLGCDNFRTRHGDAVVWCGADGPRRVWDAEGPNGPVHCRHSCGWRRRSDNGRGWWPGTVEILSDRVRFIDANSLSPKPPQHDDTTFQLHSDLLLSREFMQQVQDDAFACDLYFMLLNREINQIGIAERQGHSFRTIAGMIADVRGVGEYYLDFYPDGLWPVPSGLEKPSTAAALKAAGWRLVTSEDRFEEHCLGWELLRAYETRRETKLPDWAKDFQGQYAPSVFRRLPTTRGWNADPNKSDRLVELNTMYRRVLMLLLGQISPAEFEALSTQPQSSLDVYEKRPMPEPSEWHPELQRQLEEIEIEALSAYIPGYDLMPMDRRDEVFAPRLWLRLNRLARSGRVSEEEYEGLLKMLDEERASH